VKTAVQEDVDAVALSILSGAHMTLFPMVLELMRKEGIDDVLVVGGGIIPDEDAAKLKKMGVSEVFGPGTPTSMVVNYVAQHVRKR